MGPEERKRIPKFVGKKLSSLLPHRKFLHLGFFWVVRKLGFGNARASGRK